MDKESLERRLVTIGDEIRALQEKLYKLYEEDETDEGYQIRCAIEELSDESCDVASDLDAIEDHADHVDH